MSAGGRGGEGGYSTVRLNDYGFRMVLAEPAPVGKWRRADHGFTADAQPVTLGVMAAEAFAPGSCVMEDSTPLRLKARRLGLSGPAQWRDEAVARGCFHYLQGRTPPAQQVSEEAFSNDELALVLLGTGDVHDTWLIRLGAMLLGAEGNDPVRIARLAADEGCAPVVRAIAGAGRRYEPELPFWSTLLENLPPGAPPPPGMMPHHSRFVSLPGLIAPRTHGKAVWLRPRKVRSLGYAG